VFLGKTTRPHWGLPDPAAVSGSEAERLSAFRWASDEQAGGSLISLQDFHSRDDRNENPGRRWTRPDPAPSRGIRA
jgi:hypothetical protein